MSEQTDTQARPPVESLSFEDAQAELEAIVELLEDRHTGLDAALDLWERGEALHAWCQQRLDHAAERLQKLTISPDDVAAVQAETADEFAPTGSVPASAAVDPAPATTPLEAEAIRDEAEDLDAGLGPDAGPTIF